ncbi:MAG: DUF1761 domain-containing protein [Actinomycetota bacterium]
MDFDVNWLAVLAGTIAHQGLGGLWYGVIFKNTWLEGMGKRPEEIEEGSAGGEMVLGGFASLVSVTTLALIMTALEDPTVADGATLGAMAGVGFVTVATFMNGAYEQKKPVLSALFGGYYSLGLMIAGAILGA